MDIEAFKRYCIKPFDTDYVEKLNGKSPITIFDYLDDKLVVDCKEEYARYSRNVRSNKDTLDEIIKTDLFLGVNQPESVDEAKIIGLLKSLGYEMGDDYEI